MGSAWGKHTLNKADESARSSANLVQSVANTLGVASDSRTSGRGDTRETLLSLGLVLLRLSRGVLGHLAGLVGGVALEATGGDAEGRGADGGSGERKHRDC